MFHCTSEHVSGGPCGGPGESGGGEGGEGGGLVAEEGFLGRHADARAAVEVGHGAVEGGSDGFWARVGREVRVERVADGGGFRVGGREVAFVAGREEGRGEGRGQLCGAFCATYRSGDGPRRALALRPRLLLLVERRRAVLAAGVPFTGAGRPRCSCDARFERAVPLRSRRRGSAGGGAPTQPIRRHSRRRCAAMRGSAYDAAGPQRRPYQVPCRQARSRHHRAVGDSVSESIRHCCDCCL